MRPYATKGMVDQAGFVSANDSQRSFSFLATVSNGFAILATHVRWWTSRVERQRLRCVGPQMSKSTSMSVVACELGAKPGKGEPLLSTESRFLRVTSPLSFLSPSHSLFLFSFLFESKHNSQMTSFICTLTALSCSLTKLSDGDASSHRLALLSRSVPFPLIPSSSRS